MYWDLITFPIEHEKLKWQGQESLLDVHGSPHLFLRVKLTGTKFVHRALVPDVWVGKVFARHVQIDEDGLAVRAYFDERPRAGTLYFGYGGKPELSFGKFEARKVSVLDRKRLPSGVVLDREGPIPG
jgi:hypothetical protein